MNQCPACNSTSFPLEQYPDLGIQICKACQYPLLATQNNSMFTVFGIKRNFLINESDLQDRYYFLSRRLHPDRYVSLSSEHKASSQKLSALLNQSYLKLLDKESRLETLLTESGMEIKNSNSEIPTELAERFFDIQEELIENRNDLSESKVKKFSSELHTKEKEMREEIFELANMNWEKPEPSVVEKIIKLRRGR